MVNACICPHPPIIIPEIGKQSVAQVEKTVQVMKSLAAIIKEDPPDTIIVISPHTPIGGGFTINPDLDLEGDFSDFGVDFGYKFKTNNALIESIMNKTALSGVQCSPRRDSSLDHGVLVPLYFIKKESSDFKLVSLSVSMLDFESHFSFGNAIRSAVGELGEKVLFLASGDLSHRLFPGAPAGFSPEGREFDDLLVNMIKNNDLASIVTIDRRFADKAGECGLRSFLTLAGYLNGTSYESNVLSYEGPFGVGYLVAYFS